MCVPTPAVAGLNVPKLELVIPVPLQVHPPVAEVKFKAASEVQKGPAAVIVALGVALTVIVSVSEFEHPLTVTL